MDVLMWYDGRVSGSGRFRGWGALVNLGNLTRSARALSGWVSYPFVGVDFELVSTAIGLLLDEEADRPLMRVLLTRK